MFKFLINPSRFNKFTDIVLKPLIIISFFTLIVGLFLIYFSPLDYQQGLTVKIKLYISLTGRLKKILTIGNETKNGIWTKIKWDNIFKKTINS